MTIDIETTGLRTRSFIGDYIGRGEGYRTIPLGITQIAMHEQGTPADQIMNLYTDVVSRQMLDQWGITKEQLSDPNFRLPPGLINQLTSRRGWQPGMPIPFDPSVGKPGSVLDTVFRASAIKTLDPSEGPGILMSTRSALEQVLARWEAIHHSGEVVELSGWNVQFDVSELMRAMREHGFDTRVERLIQGRGIRIREASDNVRKMFFNAMLDSSWTPQITDRAALNAAYQLGISDPIADRAAMGRMGLSPTRQHTGLRDILNDMRSAIKGDSGAAFRRRRAGWLATLPAAARAQAERATDPLIERMARMKTFEDFERMGRELQEEAVQAPPILGRLTGHDIAGQMYANKEAPFLHVFGDPDLATAIRRSTGQAGLSSAFGMISGSRLPDVAGVMLAHADVLEIAAPVQLQLREQLARAHFGEEDVLQTELIDQELQRISADQAKFVQMQELLVDNHDRGMDDRVRQLWHDIRGTRANPPAAKIPLKTGASKSWLTGMRPGAAWWLAGGVAALYIASQWNNQQPVKQIQGLRTPDSQHDSIEGIDPSMLPFANVSAFGSGYDPFQNYAISATTLGARFRQKYARQDPDAVGSSEAVIAGERIHKRIQRELQLSGIAPSPETYAHYRGIGGYIDTVLKGGIPMEIKTVESTRDLWALTGPKPAHQSQLNLYATAQGTPYGYLMYVSREDSRQRRVFRVRQDAARLSEDLAFLGNAIGSGNAEAAGMSRVGPMASLKRRMRMLVTDLTDFVGITGVEPTGEDPFLWAGLEQFEDYDPAEFGGAYPEVANEGPRLSPFSRYVSNLMEHGNTSRIRDHQTRLYRLPYQIRTPTGRPGSSGHAEMEYAEAI